MPTLQPPTSEKTAKLCCTAIASLISLGLVAVTKPADAFSVTYNFTVQVTSDAYESQGLLSGTTQEGSFTYNSDGLTPYKGDDLVETKDEYVSPSKGNLTLTFNFLNNRYLEKDDLNYGSEFYVPDYPAALFTDGKLLGLDYLVVPSQFQPPQSALGFRIYKDAFYVGSIDSSSNGSGLLVGTVAYINTATLPAPPPPSNGVAAVPEPSEIGGAIVAISVLGFWMRTAKGRR
ncbi:MAG: hypothetical protein KME27_25990 [Lyngbya sp. HA4199-MV5]|jgi:hypothetical protein|nr:hypothetical protein [Lyngbya sp. HA4199-MV5]